MVSVQRMKMTDFTSLLNDLATTCRELEQIKEDQTKDHERVSKSFEKTLLSILKQEQTILSRVEEEHGRLRDRLSSIQQSNELVLQNGIYEINNVVQEIAAVSSQLKQALVTSNDSQFVMKEIQHRISNIFARKNRISINLRKVYFIPQPLPPNTLGAIQCEDHPLGFSMPYCNRTSHSPQGKNSSVQPTLLSDEKPPWEVKSHNPDDFGFVGVKILLEDDSDGDSVSTTQPSSLEQDKGDVADLKRKISSRDKAVVEADNAALSPRTATKKWISEIKQSPQKQAKPQGPGAINQAEESSKLTRPPPLGSRQLSKDSTKVIKSFNQQVNHFPTGKDQNSKIHSPGLKKDLASHPQRTWTTSKETNITVDVRNSTDAKLRCVNHDQVGTTSEVNSLYRATAAYICKGDSDTSEEILEEVEMDTTKDPMACRQVALRDSRVPSAKKLGGGDQRAQWMTVEFHGHMDRPDEDSPEPTLSRRNLESDHKTQLGVDYLRMSDETSDNSELLSVPRPASPTESVKSTCTFIIEKPKNRGISKSGTFRVSASKMQHHESGNGHPIISESESSEVNRRQQALSNAKNRIVSKLRSHQSQASSSWKPVPRSSSMPYIEKTSRPRTAPSRLHRPASAKERRDSVSSSSSSWSNPRSLATSAPSGALREIRIRVKSAQYNRRASKCGQQMPPRKTLSKSESNLTGGPPENGDGATKLVRQFGKFGSGRAELNLPHGIHATSAGSVYIVDYGNRRLQVMDGKGKVLQQFSLEAKNYFDAAVNNRGLVALTNSTDRTLDVYSKHGRLLQVVSRNWGAPRGITANYRDEFIVADMKLGTVCALTLDSSTGRQKESTVVPGFNKPYLVSSNSQGLLAVSERGLDGGCCVKVLREDWQLLKILGLKESPGPSLCNPWGVCVDSEGGVLVADWGQKHSVIYYPANRPARVLVTEGLSSPRGLALLQDGILLVADSMHNCIKVFKYQENE